MNILVCGSNGQLGNEIKDVVKLFGTFNKYIFTDVDTLDITDFDTTYNFAKDNSINVIINCAAYTNVDKAEDDYVTADKINHVAVNNLALITKRIKGTLIHISTDYVFKGNNPNPYIEFGGTEPMSVYGKTKLAGEQAIIKSECNHIILRTAWLYSEYGKNFVKTMLSLLKEKDEINVVYDQIGSPTYAFDLAKTIFDIVENRKYENNDGIYHYTNEGVCSWYDFTKMIAYLTNNKKTIINPCLSNEFKSKVKRPNYSVLNKNKIKETFGINVPYWIDSLKVCLKNMDYDA